jgi:hypothetical protein
MNELQTAGVYLLGQQPAKLRHPKAANAIIGI